MNEVLIIGPTLATTNCYLHSPIKIGEVNNALISSITSSGCLYLAISLSELGVHTSYVSKLANDNEGQKIWGLLDNHNVIIYSCGSLQETPLIINIYDSNVHKTSIQQATLNIYPDDPSSIPSLLINSADYGFLDIIDSNFIYYLIYRYPNKKWISKHIPNDNVLPSIEGICLPYEDAIEIIAEDNFVELANRLIGKGIKWLIITKEEKGIYFFSTFTTFFYDFALKFKEKMDGLYEFYLALLLTCLVRGFEIDQAIQYANEQYVNSLTSAN